MNMRILATVIVATSFATSSAPVNVFARSAVAPVAPVPGACSRPAAGSVIRDAPSLSSVNGVLRVNLSYQTRTDAQCRTLYCFITPAGLQNPTFHVHPGDHLVGTVTNNVPASPGMAMAMTDPQCGAATMTPSSMNIH